MTHKINLLATIIRSQWTTGFGLGGLWLISQCFPNMEAWKLNFFLFFFFFVLMWFVICCWLTPSCEQIMTWRCIPLPWRQVAYSVCLSSANTNSSRFTLSQTLNEASPVSLLRFPKTTNDSQLAEMIIGEMVSGSAWTFSSSMVHVYVTVGCNHISRCVFPLCARLEHCDIFRYANQTRCFCHALRKLFTRDCDELLDSLEHKSGVLPLWRTPVLLTGSIRWGNGTHFKDKHEKYPDKTDNKRRVWVQKVWYCLFFFFFVVLVSFSHLGRTTVPVMVCHFPFSFCCSVRLFKTFPWVLMFFIF